MSRPKGSKNGQKKLIEIKCERCGKIFLVEPYQSSRKYCSHECRRIYGDDSNRCKARRKYLKQHGICIECGKSPAIDAVRCDDCRSKANKSNRKWRESHIEEIKAARRNISEQNKKVERETRRTWRRELRQKVLELYGGKCECCGESTIEFLQIDHINKDGKRHREEVGRGVKLLRDVLKNFGKYDIRVLCANCHNAITAYGKCPHEIQVPKDPAFAVVKGSD